MITDVLKPDGSAESTARRLITHFERQGVSPGEIDTGHLQPLYTSLKRSRFSASGREVSFPALQRCNLPDKAVWGVIVETREHPALAGVVAGFMKRLGIRVQLFHGVANEAFIRSSGLANLLAGEKLVLSSLDLEALSPVEYNALFLSQEFWRAMRGRGKILVFQTDACLCANSEYRLREFLDFDYIGSTWQRERPVGMVIDGGNGGLSLRDWELSTRCLERFSPRWWPGGEDGFFAFHMELAGGRVAKQDDCARFSTQSQFKARSFGAHKVSELDEADRQRFLDYCPEAKLPDAGD